MNHQNHVAETVTSDGVDGSVKVESLKQIDQSSVKHVDQSSVKQIDQSSVTDSTGNSTVTVNHSVNVTDGQKPLYIATALWRITPFGNGGGGVEVASASTSASEHSEQRQLIEKAQPNNGACADQSANSTSGSTNRSLDQILSETEVHSVERISETIPSRRPSSLVVSQDKVRKQSMGSTPTSPLSALPESQASADTLYCNTAVKKPSSTDPLHLTTQLSSPGVIQSPGSSTATMVSFTPTPKLDALETLRPVTESHFVVVAIDFGTTMSGYAFSFVRDPSSIHMMRKWEGGDPGVINQKTPTTLLLNPEGEFHSFGFNARDSYHDLDAKEAKRWLYFEKFKMSLHYSAKLNKETTIAASNGKAYPALKVFCHALKYFKDHALEELSDQSSTEILNEDIRWVITVPAIWKAPAKQFMRQAAYDAGIGSSDNPGQLLIALEPEAASIYVRRLRVHQLLDPATPPDSAQMSPFKSDNISPLSATLPSPSRLSPSTPGQASDVQPGLFDDQQNSPDNRVETLQNNLRLFDSLPRQQTVGVEMNDGTRYMVVDCGGGTVDITVHEMQANTGYLHELYKATGGPYGSVGVDVAFESLLQQIFGSEFIETFKAKRPAGWVDLMIAFESRKRAANSYKKNPLNVSLPFSFIDFYKKSKGSPVESAINKLNDPEIRWSSQGMLRLSPEAMKRLFRSTVDHIKQAIGDVLNTVKDIKYLFLVGGFAESPILQHEIRHDFSHILKILIPQDVALTILKGAVCFGLDPTVVTVRRSRLTYGVDVLNRFNPDKHPKSKLCRKDGNEWCTGVFDRFVSADQPVSLGETVVRKYSPAKVGQKVCIFSIYCSEKGDVQFVTDPGVSKCGTLTLNLADVECGGTSSGVREVQAVMTFGDTEIKVHAVDMTTGKTVTAAIDFLNK